MNDETRMDRDLEALRQLSVKDVPDLDATIQDIRRRGLDSSPAPWNWRRRIMALFHWARTRPAVAALVLGALAVLVAMIIPISYDRVTGQDVALTVAGKGIGSPEIAGVAQGLKHALGTNGVRVEAVSSDQGPRFVLHATLPRRSGTEAQRLTTEFARDLAAKGYAASVQVRPHVERVRYPAVAYAFDQIINIDVGGKSAAALEAEIRDKFAQAGIPDALVSVTDRPNGGREVKLTVERQHVNDGSTPPPEPMPQLVLSKDGAPLGGGHGFMVKVQKRKLNDAVTLLLDVTAEGKSAKIEIPNSNTMSDAAITDAVTTQLRQSGIDARVTVTAGKVSIEENK